MNKTMLFSFDPPIVFERIYTFDNPNFIFCWYAEDSNPELIKSNNYRTKKILVKELFFILKTLCTQSHYLVVLVLKMVFSYQ